MSDRAVTITEAMQRLGLSRSTLDRMHRDGTLTRREPPGHRPFYAESQIAAYLNPDPTPDLPIPPRRTRRHR